MCVIKLGEIRESPVKHVDSYKASNLTILVVFYMETDSYTI